MKWWHVVIIIIVWDCARLMLQAIVNKWWLRKNKGIVWQEEKHEGLGKKIKGEKDEG